MPGLFARPWVHVAVAEWELLLGTWLVLGPARRAAWTVAVATFGTFAVVSGWLGWSGVASCGCFGPQSNPWLAFAVDVAALAGLAVAGRPMAQATGEAPREWAGSVLGGLGLVGVAMAALVAWTGSVGGALAVVSGEVVVASPVAVDFGAGEPGQVLERDVTLTNHSGQPVRVIGGNIDCTCQAASHLPLVIPPAGTQTLTLRLKVPSLTPGRFDRSVEFWTDSDRQRTVRRQVACDVRPAPGNGSPD